MDFEKLGSFYLGKEYDPSAGKLLDRLVMYDARDLTTHAVCVGMTGSGKTGLCLALLEEAAMDRVPALIIDPKGDIANLLLTFPDLAPGDFAPWINTDDARRKNLDPGAYAAAQAETWRKGLAEWGMTGERIRILRETADFAVFTPGSEAGIPVSILQSFAAPPPELREDAELLRERIQGMVGALLGLIGVEADPVKSREHILISTIIEHFWGRGEDLDLPALILAIQDPPVRRMGVFDVDTFLPRKERFELAMGLNNIVASPSFASWLAGQPLDIGGFLAAPDGRPRHAVFSIAHLAEAERMFFVTILLNQVIAWMRAQPGTTSLRALLYMDEIFGFFPPVANPPSKTPMLTLLKQARAFGLGVVLTTQNPVDLDYKGLTNTGTWFIGRLQTERDKERVMDGLLGASAQAGGSLDRAALGALISGLGNRVFLLHNVHEEAPLVFQTRWAMSYLRGPLTRRQIQDLMRGREPDGAVTATVRAVSSKAAGRVSSGRPSVGPGVRQVFLAASLDARRAEALLRERTGVAGGVGQEGTVYLPAVAGAARVRISDRKLGLDSSEDVVLLLPLTGGPVLPDWEEAREAVLGPGALGEEPDPGAQWEDLPGGLDAKTLKSMEGRLVDHLSRKRQVTLFFNPSLKTYSRPGESERDFVRRLVQESREERDREVDRLQDRYRDRLEALGDRLRRAESVLAQKQASAQARQAEMLVSVGTTLLGMFLGRRSTRAATGAVGKYRMTRTAGMGAEAAQENVEDLKQEMTRLEEELRGEMAELEGRWEAAAARVQPVSFHPRKGDVSVSLVALAWVPHHRFAWKDGSGVPREELVPAC
jgi:hypothetical protein